jgi:xanthine dehydrogenase accessory factor
VIIKNNPFNSNFNMKEFLQQIEEWQNQKKKIALARVIQTWGSSPRPVGSCMLISSDLEMAGSVSGGCVEGAILKEAKNVFETGSGKRLYYGVTDDEAWAVGLSCGGKIQVYIQPWGEAAESMLFEQLAMTLTKNEGAILLTQLTDGPVNNSLLSKTGAVIAGNFSENIALQGREAYEQRLHKTISEGNEEYFIHIFPPRSKVIIIGAAHITADLIGLAHHYDFETIVIDPRSTFAKNTTFQVAPDHLHEKYPSEVLGDIDLDPYTYCVILSHDPKIDDDALKVLLRTKVAYIGALGSKKNHEKRTARLLDHGFTSEEISKINAPIGVDIHAQGAKEIALSIMGAIIRAKNAHR